MTFFNETFSRATKYQQPLLSYPDPTFSHILKKKTHKPTTKPTNQSFVYVFIPLAKGQHFYLSFFQNSLEQQRYCSEINNRTAIATMQF